MNPIRDIRDIEAEFPEEWVLIGDPQADEGSRLLAGRVLFHSANRDDVHQKALEWKLPYFAVRYFGTIPENTALVL